jgi:hypothetical protein
MNLKYAPLLLLSFALIGCAPQIVQPDIPTYPGFDSWRYPGTDTMRVWREASPYRWTGYYLESPCHRGRSFMGRRAELEQMNWGIAVLYVGQQTWDGIADLDEEPEVIICSRTLLTEEEGRRNGRDAVTKMAGEGFPAGSTVFLNVERMDSVTDSMVVYYRSWLREVLRDGRFLPGTYAHRRNAETLLVHAQSAFLEFGRAETPPFWVAGGPGFGLEVVPAAAGLPFVEIWQGALDIERTWGGITFQIDENVATRRNPSAPRAEPRAGT